MDLGFKFAKMIIALYLRVVVFRGVWMDLILKLLLLVNSKRRLSGFLKGVIKILNSNPR